MTRRLQRTTGPKRGLAAFVLALFALGWLADRAHVAYEAHAYCAEHHQLEHAAHDHDHAREGSAAHGPEHELARHEHAAPIRGPAIEALEGALEAHAACCLLLGRGGEPLALPRALALAFGPARVESALSAAAHGTSPRGSIPLLALAPKQSPPAV